MDINQKTPMITKALQETVNDEEHIKKIYFDFTGNHYFTVHKYVHEGNDTEGQKKNGLYGRIDVRTVASVQTGREITIKTPIMKTRIVKQMTREEVLNAESVSNLLSPSLMNTLTPAEQDAVKKIRAGAHA
jgi:hypothetical protein